MKRGEYNYWSYLPDLIFWQEAIEIPTSLEASDNVLPEESKLLTCETISGVTLPLRDSIPNRL